MASISRILRPKSLPEIDVLRADAEPFSMDLAKRRQVQQVAIMLASNVGLTRRYLLDFDTTYTNQFVMHLQFAIGRSVNPVGGVRIGPAIASEEVGYGLTTLVCNLDEGSVDSPELLRDLNVSMLGMHHAIRAELQDRQGVVPHALKPDIITNLQTVRSIVPEVFGIQR